VNLFTTNQAVKPAKAVIVLFSHKTRAVN